MNNRRKPKDIKDIKDITKTYVPFSVVFKQHQFSCLEIGNKAQGNVRQENLEGIHQERGKLFDIIRLCLFACSVSSF